MKPIVDSKVLTEGRKVPAFLKAAGKESVRLACQKARS